MTTINALQMRYKEYKKGLLQICNCYTKIGSARLLHFFTIKDILSCLSLYKGYYLVTKT